MADHEEPLVCEPLRTVGDVTPAVLTIPAGTCDAHMHVFGPLDRYPCVAHPHYTHPQATLGDYRDVAAHLGIDRFVIVQPSFYDSDNRALLDALAAAGHVARGVVMIEPDIPDDELDRYHGLGVRGVRLDLFKRAQLPRDAIEAYIAASASRVARLGWHLQFYAPGWLVRDLNDFLARLEIDFAIDHMGYMLEKDGVTDADFARLIGLLETGHCWLKLSAPYRLAADQAAPSVTTMAAAIVAAAPERTLWGSDWPHLPKLSRDTGAILNLLAAWAPDPAIRHLILADNPARLFDF